MTNLEYVQQLCKNEPDWVHQQLAFELDKRDAHVRALKKVGQIVTKMRSHLGAELIFAESELYVLFDEKSGEYKFHG